MRKDLLEKLERRAGDATALLETWVSTNSFSRNVEGVNRMGGLLGSAFALPGLALTVQSGNGVGDHLCWRTPAWDRLPQERVLLVGHHDTVFAPGTFEGWTREGDVARGPGTLDMKGGLALVYATLATLADADLLADIPLALISVGDEEIGSPDSRRFTEELARGARAALVFEAGRAEDAIITQRKGTGAFKVSVTGKASHAGNFHAEGINAIWVAARVIVAVQELTDYERGRTINVGTVSGGTSRNTVPGTAECEIDFRFIHADDGREICEAIGKIAADVAEMTGAAIDLTGGIRRLPMVRTDASVALYEQYAACAREANLGDVESPLLGGGSDGNTAAGVGVPVIDGLGLRGKGFHTHDEYVEVSSLQLRADALLRFLLQVPKSKSLE